MGIFNFPDVGLRLRLTRHPRWVPAGCVGAVTQTVKALDASATLSVDLPTKKVPAQTTQDRATVAEALAKAGYPAD